ncbi:molybdenum ABC transporter ATP-binding protein [Maricaulis parjimensis]|uniref:molybdenum ABC transporter ATP-binding protein n=1 Tax=Maricaulis parjimensis TaxID=144023 RepID=UPI001939ECBF|nr:molybdenum ABC transporter ATP-binding protein [Maricaulis parjimensis]
MADRVLDFNLTAQRGNFRLLAEGRIPLSGVTSISGPSGAGKTSLLRALAGLDRNVSGEVRLGDEVWMSGHRTRPVYTRRIGMVFQDTRLFSHLDVAGNLAYAARRAAPDQPGPSQPEIIDLLDLDGLLGQSVRSLSGGERQRVALGRALASRPRLLILDEAFSALDAARRNRLLPGLRALLDHHELPALHVSHSLSETAQLADHALPILSGRTGTLMPVNDWFAQQDSNAPDPCVLVTGRLSAHDKTRQLSRVSLGQAQIELPGLSDIPEGAPLRLLIHTRDVAIARTRLEGLSIRNQIPVRLAAIRDVAGSAYCDLSLDLDGQVLMARITRSAAEDLELATGETLIALIKSASLDPGRE